jgi:hypothetical protein
MPEKKGEGLLGQSDRDGWMMPENGPCTFIFSSNVDTRNILPFVGIYHTNGLP